MNSLGIFENGEGVFPILAPALEKYGGAAFKTDFSLDGRIYPLIFAKNKGRLRIFSKTDSPPLREKRTYTFWNC